MRLKLEGNYFTIFTMIASSCLIIVIVATGPIYGGIEDSKRKSHERDSAQYYQIDNEKYTLESVAADGTITLKKANK